jgi:phosphoenolpyruvate carboxykinase (GTP)
MADYFAHWLKIGQQLKKPPLIFRMNWFRRDRDGNFLWPAYGENIRVLKWILDRVRGTGRAEETPLGFLPTPGAIDTEGLALGPGAMEELTSVDKGGWLNGVKEMEKFYAQFGERLPGEMWNEHRGLRNRLEALQG